MAQQFNHWNQSLVSTCLVIDWGFMAQKQLRLCCTSLSRIFSSLCFCPSHAVFHYEPKEAFAAPTRDQQHDQLGPAQLGPRGPAQTALAPRRAQDQRHSAPERRTATFVPPPKPGKLARQLGSHRPITLKLSVGKLFKRMVLRRLPHHLETAAEKCFSITRHHSVQSKN